MPNTRRFSNSSVASASSRQAFPATIDSSTKVTKEKVGNIMTRRRRQAAAKDKENSSSNVMQSPTPYWRVAKERGTTTPPQTRSCKKRKSSVKRLDFSPPKPTKFQKSGDSSGILEFSPPDQVENARREKQELDRKQRDKDKRTKKARDSGQLLIFSPTFRNPAPLPPGAHNLERAKAEDPPPTCSPPQNIKDNLTQDVSESELSESNDQTNNLIKNELKSLQDKIDQLVERQEMDSQSNHHLSLEAHMLKTEKMLVEKAKLEDKVEKLEEVLKANGAKSAGEKEELVAKQTELEGRILEMKSEAESRLQALQKARDEIEIQLQSSQRENGELLEQITKLQEKLAALEEELRHGKKQIEALQKEFQAEKHTMNEEREELQRSGSELQNAYSDLQSSNESLRATIAAYEEKIDAFENSLLPESEDQLQRALAQLQEREEAADEYARNIDEYTTEISSLRNRIDQMREEQAQERKHFQTLNEESSKAYESMTMEIKEKDQIIDSLENKLAETASNLETEKDRFQHTSKSLEETRIAAERSMAELRDALSTTTRQLDERTEEKQILEGKIMDMTRQLNDEANFKADAMSKSNEVSAYSARLEKKILELESELKSTRSERDNATYKMATFHEREEELFNKLQESDRVRRSLHNRVMQLSGNIRVYVRVRPALPGEKEAAKAEEKAKQVQGKRKRKDIDREEESPFHYPGAGGAGEAKNTSLGADDPTKNLLEVTEPRKDRGGLSERRKKWTFGFDNIFTPQHGQQDIWEGTEPLVQSAIDGYNVTIFAYGQTGSGKTYTMLGEPDNEGVISRSIKKLFDAKDKIAELTRGGSKVDISVELLEIYNEKVRDLLAPNNDTNAQSLKIKANEAVGSTIQPVADAKEVELVLHQAQKRRCVKATSSNAVSSRSHMLFTMHFKVTTKSGSVRVGKLNVCDLAGSERLGKSNANEHVGSDLMKETKHINTSLSALSNVIEKLQAGDANVPFRESKLTYLLQNSLGGNSKTLAIVCCNPLLNHFHESLCSLRFAAKVNKVDLKAVANFSA